MAGAPHEVVSAFKGGNLVVKHQFPAGITANVEVHIAIDAQTLAGKVADIKFKGTNKMLKSVSTTAADGTSGN